MPGAVGSGPRRAATTLGRGLATAAARTRRVTWRGGFRTAACRFAATAVARRRGRTRRSGPSLARSPPPRTCRPSSARGSSARSPARAPRSSLACRARTRHRRRRRAQTRPSRRRVRARVLRRRSRLPRPPAAPPFDRIGGVRRVAAAAEARVVVTRVVRGRAGCHERETVAVVVRDQAAPRPVSPRPRR